MKRWFKRTLLVTLGSALIAVGLSACGHGGMHGDWLGGEAGAAQMRERILERAGQELQLDATQKQRLGVLLDKLHDQRTALMGPTDPRSQFQTLIAGPSFDRSGAQALVDAKTAALRERSPEVIAAAGDFFDGLRPEQQARVREFLARRHGWSHRS